MLKMHSHSIGARGMPGEFGRPGPRGDAGEGGINSKGTKGINSNKQQ